MFREVLKEMAEIHFRTWIPLENAREQMIMAEVGAWRKTLNVAARDAAFVLVNMPIQHFEWRLL